jgi:hypothetical protein
LVLQQALYLRRRCKNLVRRVFYPIRGAISEASATARGTVWQTREAPNGWKFHPRTRPLSPTRAADARFRRRRSISPLRRRSASPAPPLASLKRSTVLYSRRSRRHRQVQAPRIPPLASPALHRRPCLPRAYFQHGARAYFQHGAP